MSFLLNILLFFVLICTEATHELISAPCRAAQPASNCRFPVIFKNTVKYWELSASQTVLSVQMQTFWRSDVLGTAPFPVHTNCDALSLPCSLVSVCPGKQNHGDLFSVSAAAAKEGPALQFWWESSDVTLVVLRQRSTASLLPPLPRCLSEHDPTITHQQYC